MINRRAACNCLVGIERDNRLETEKFLQAIDDHIKARHASIHNHGVNLNIARAEFDGGFFQHVENRQDNIFLITEFGGDFG